MEARFSSRSTIYILRCGGMLVAPTFFFLPGQHTKIEPGGDHGRNVATEECFAEIRKIDAAQKTPDTRGANASWSGACGAGSRRTTDLSRRAAAFCGAGVHNFLGRGVAGCGEQRVDDESESIFRLHSDERADGSAWRVQRRRAEHRARFTRRDDSDYFAGAGEFGAGQRHPEFNWARDRGRNAACDYGE